VLKQIIVSIPRVLSQYSGLVDAVFVGNGVGSFVVVFVELVAVVREA
jgi:hypothetical protein